MRSAFLIVILQFIVLSTFAQVGFTQEGFAAAYPEKFEGKTTASGESYSFRKATCSHLTIPFGALVKVTNLSNNQSVVVRVNDRGPFVPDRIMDLSKSAADKLGITTTAKVKIEVIEDPIQQMIPSTTTANVQSDSKQIVSNTKTIQANSNQVVKDELNQNESEIYELKVSQVAPKGFAIQIGSYKELVNMLRIADDIRVNLKKEVRVQVLNVNGEKAYRLFVGSFSTRKDAESFKVKAAKIYPGCFITELK